MAHLARRVDSLLMIEPALTPHDRAWLLAGDEAGRVFTLVARLEGLLTAGHHRGEKALEIPLVAAVPAHDLLEFLDVVLARAEDQAAPLVAHRIARPVVELHRRVTQLVIEQGGALLDAHLARIPELLAQQDDEIERRELAIEVRGLLALPERDLAVDVRLPRGVPRERDPRLENLGVMLAHQLAQHQVHVPALRSVRGDEFVTYALWPFWSSCSCHGTLPIGRPSSRRCADRAGLRLRRRR